MDAPMPKDKTAAAGWRPERCDRIALVLQGGGALGAYQAGVYQAMAEAGLQPGWVAGISIGAINAAIIAGNPPERRVDQLRRFWEGVCPPDPFWTGMVDLEKMPAPALGAIGQMAAARALFSGQPNFFRPRLPSPLLAAPGSQDATSFYDTAPLRETLIELVDFDRINHPGGMRLSVGAVQVRTGNFIYFDTGHRSEHHRGGRFARIGPEHVMASGALPPGFPAVEIDGEPYWDGGLVSNTPLEYVFEDQPRQDRVIFQVDLWSARGLAPKTIGDVLERDKDIRYSSRTRKGTDQVVGSQRYRRAIAHLLARLPDELRRDPALAPLRELACEASMSIIHLIYRRKNYETHSKDYEFSRLAMVEHWDAGHRDTVEALRRPQWFSRPPAAHPVVTHDIGRVAGR